MKRRQGGFLIAKIHRTAGRVFARMLRERGVQINPAGGLSQGEIDQIIQEAEENKQADQKRKAVRQLKNKLEGQITGNERVFREFGKLLGTDERDRITRTLQHAREGGACSNAASKPASGDGSAGARPINHASCLLFASAPAALRNVKSPVSDTLKPPSMFSARVTGSPSSLSPLASNRWAVSLPSLASSR